eukprot:15447421-Alexandrium_andersonii.AAC.1
MPERDLRGPPARRWRGRTCPRAPPRPPTRRRARQGQGRPAACVLQVGAPSAWRGRSAGRPDRQLAAGRATERPAGRTAPRLPGWEAGRPVEPVQPRGWTTPMHQRTRDA